MRALLALALLVACGGAGTRKPPIVWDAPLEIATGGGERGPWHQNNSQYDHVDDPEVILDPAGAAIVAWVDHRHKDVFVQIFERDGTARHPDAVNVSRTPDVFSWLPRVVQSPLDPRQVFALWQEIVFSGGSHGGDILFARSHDGGASFDPPRNLSSSVGGDGKGRIDKRTWSNGSHDLAVGNDGTLYAAWTEYEGALWFTRSRDRGATFAAPAAIVADTTRPARAPALATRGDVVHLAWTTGEDASADIWIASSGDRGTTFTPPSIVARTPGYSDAPKLVIDRQGTLHLVFADSAGGPFDRHEVRYTRSRDGGKTFEPARELSRPHPGDTESAAFPALAVDDRRGVHVLWELYPDHRRPPRGLALASSFDGGDTFAAPAEVPHSADPAGGGNGSFQGRLMHKLAVRGEAIAVVNSSLAFGRSSRVWLIRGRVAVQGATAPAPRAPDRSGQPHAALRPPSNGRPRRSVRPPRPRAPSCAVPLTVGVGDRSGRRARAPSSRRARRPSWPAAAGRTLLRAPSSRCLGDRARAAGLGSGRAVAPRPATAPGSRPARRGSRAPRSDPPALPRPWWRPRSAAPRRGGRGHRS